MIKKVNRERWEEAQNWEKSFWDKSISASWSLRGLRIFKTIAKMIIRDGPGDDSNYWWAGQFNNYEFVPNTLNNVVEFGCGPFTNLRIILKNRVTKHVFDSDPLVKYYVKYKGYQLAKKWKKQEYLIDDHPLEEAPFADNYFDLVICINVLDHVQDPDICLKQLVRVTAMEGLLIFGQDLTNYEDLKSTEKERLAANGDVGHPHIFDNSNELLEYFDSFDPIINRILKREEGRGPKWHFSTLIFAGKKKSSILREKS